MYVNLLTHVIDWEFKTGMMSWRLSKINWFFSVMLFFFFFWNYSNAEKGENAWRRWLGHCTDWGRRRETSLRHGWKTIQTSIENQFRPASDNLDNQSYFKPQIKTQTIYLVYEMQYNHPELMRLDLFPLKRRSGVICDFDHWPIIIFIRSIDGLEKVQD